MRNFSDKIVIENQSTYVWCSEILTKVVPFMRIRKNVADCAWNVTAHAQKRDFVFRRNGRVHLTLILLTWKIWWAPNNASKWQMGFNSALKVLYRQGRQFSRLLATEVCASAVVMLDTPCSEVVWRVLANHSTCFSFTTPSVRHRVPSHFNWTLQPHRSQMTIPGYS